MILERLVPYIFLTGGLLIGVSVFWYLRLWERGEEERWDVSRQRPEAPAGPAVPRRLPRLFLIGFTLCVLSGPLVLWMLIRGGVSPAPGPGAVGAAVLERLPDAATQARQHAELIEAIRGLGPTAPGRLQAPSGPVQIHARWQWPTAPGALAAVGALLVLAAGVIALARAPGAWGRMLGVGICVIACALLVDVGPQLMTFTLEPPAGTEPPAAAGQRLIHAARIGPFPDAGHVLTPGPIAAAIGKLRRAAPLDEAGFVLVVGHVDRRPLGGAARALYGTDAGLAQARANWVRARLLELAGGALEAERVLALPAGPASAGLPDSLGAAADDRCVDILVFAVPRSGP